MLLNSIILEVKIRILLIFFRPELLAQLLQKNQPTNMLALLQQMQQIQLQQKAAAASVNTIGVAQATNLMNDLRLQQEALMSQLAGKQVLPQQQQQLPQQQAQKLSGPQQQQQQQQRAQFNDPTSIDPAILDAGLTSQSIWGDMPSKKDYFNHFMDEYKSNYQTKC